MVPGRDEDRWARVQRGTQEVLQVRVEVEAGPGGTAAPGDSALTPPRLGVTMLATMQTTHGSRHHAAPAAARALLLLT